MGCKQKIVKNTSLEECSNIRSAVIFVIFADKRMVEVERAQQQTKWLILKNSRLTRGCFPLDFQPNSFLFDTTKLLLHLFVVNLYCRNGKYDFESTCSYSTLADNDLPSSFYLHNSFLSEWLMTWLEIWIFQKYLVSCLLQDQTKEIFCKDTCYGAQRRLFLRFVNRSSCPSGDQYFKAANAMTNSHAKVSTGSSPAFLATCLISRWVE